MFPSFVQLSFLLMWFKPNNNRFGAAAVPRSHSVTNVDIGGENVHVDDSRVCFADLVGGTSGELPLLNLSSRYLRTTEGVLLLPSLSFLGILGRREERSRTTRKHFRTSCESPQSCRLILVIAVIGFAMVKKVKHALRYRMFFTLCTFHVFPMLHFLALYFYVPTDILRSL